MAEQDTTTTDYEEITKIDRYNYYGVFLALASGTKIDGYLQEGDIQVRKGDKIIVTSDHVSPMGTVIATLYPTSNTRDEVGYLTWKGVGGYSNPQRPGRQATAAQGP